MWYKLALLGAACIVFIIGWLAFDKPDVGLYGMLVAAAAAMLKSPLDKP